MSAITSGYIRVWGGDLSEVQSLHLDTHGNLDGGPILDCQDEIEEQAQEGATNGTLSNGYKWEYA